MNISRAKQVIKDTVSIYLKRDDNGDYCIPVVRQRPIFLLGAPGIGKTQIVAQVLKSYKKNPSAFTGRPRLPGYCKEKGLKTAILTNQICG